MDHPTQVRLIQRVLDLLGRGMVDAMDKPARRRVTDYTNPDRFVLEQDILFRNHPVVVAHSGQLGGPGTFVTHDATGVPLLVTRDPRGRLRALLNVCRHRGTRLVDMPCGHRDKFVCPYHAWTYASDGRLIKITDEHGFTGIDRERMGLTEVPAAERHGFVWVAPTPGPRFDIDRYLGPIGADLASFRLESHFEWKPRRMRRAMNWKLAFDVFLEAYHVRYVHGRSIAPIFFDNLGVFERFEPHLRNLFPKRTIQSLSNTDPSGWQLRAHANVLYVLFPNTLLLIEPDHAAYFRVFPDGIDACHIEGALLLPEAPTNPKAEAYWQKNADILFGAVEEDLTLGESIQRGLRSQANESLTFGRFEPSLHWFHSYVDAALDRGGP